MGQNRKSDQTEYCQMGRISEKYWKESSQIGKVTGKSARPKHYRKNYHRSATKYEVFRKKVKVHDISDYSVE